MGQKPRVCSSYFFEMEDGSRIEVRRELFLSWLQRGNHDENKTEQIERYISSLKEQADSITIGVFCDGEGEEAPCKICTCGGFNTLTGRR